MSAFMVSSYGHRVGTGFAFHPEFPTSALAFPGLSYVYTVTKSLWHHQVPSAMILCHLWAIPQLRGHSNAKKFELWRVSKEYTWEGKVLINTLCLAHVPMFSCIDIIVPFVVKHLQTFSEKRQVYKEVSVCLSMFSDQQLVKTSKYLFGVHKIWFPFLFDCLDYGRLDFHNNLR